MKPHYILFTLLLLYFPLTSAQLIRLPVEKQPQAPAPQSSKFLDNSINLYRDSGSLGVQNYGDWIYVSPIKIGWNDTTFNVILDTGSSDLWIPHTSIKRPVKNIFDCSKSLTCQELYGSIDLRYGKGSMKGVRVSDHLNFRGMVIHDFKFSLAKEVKDMDLIRYDGLLGLGIGTSRSTGHPSILDRLRQSGAIKDKIFSIYLGDHRGSNGTFTGEIIFGGYDPKYAQSEFQFLRVKTERETVYWESEIQNFGFDQKNNLTEKKVSVIFDTGASFLLLPEALFKKVLGQLDSFGTVCTAAANNEYLCSSSGDVKLLPDMVFYFDKIKLKIPSTSFLQQRGPGKYRLEISTLASSSGISEKILLGDVFLKNFYAMYSADNYTVGFAKPIPTQVLSPPVEQPPMKYPKPVYWTGGKLIVLILLVFGVISFLVCKYWKAGEKGNTGNSYVGFLNESSSSFKGVSIGGDSEAAQKYKQRQEEIRKQRLADEAERGNGLL